MSLEVGEKEEKLLYYCSCDVFESIIKNKSIWFSRFKDCKDLLEDNLFISLFQKYSIDKVCSKLLSSEKVENKDAAYILHHELQNRRINNSLFGMCLSKSADNPALWQNFVGGEKGVCIEFDEKKLKNEISKMKCGEESINIFDVQYIDFDYEGYEKQFKDTLNKFKDILDCNEKIINLDDAFVFLEESSSKYKHKSFEYEKEKRIILKSYKNKDREDYLPIEIIEPNGSKKKIQISYNKKLHYEIPLDLSIIRKVILSPKLSSLLEFKSLKFVDNDFEFDIVPSELRYFVNKNRLYNKEFDDDIGYEYLKTEEGIKELLKGIDEENKRRGK